MAFVGIHHLAREGQGLTVEGHGIQLMGQHVGQKGMAACRHGCGGLCPKDEFHAPSRPWIARREGPKRFEVGAVRGRAMGLEAAAKHLRQHGDHLGRAVVPKEIVRVGGVLRLCIPLEVSGQCTHVFRRQIQHLFVQRAALTEVEVLEPAVAFDAKAVVHSAADKPHVKSFVDHKGAVVEHPVRSRQGIVEANGRVAKRGVQV